MNNFYLDMQKDTGSEVMFIPRNFPHWKANFTKEQFTTPPIWWVGPKNL